MKAKEEILKAKTAHEVLEWMKATPAPHDLDVVEYFQELRRKEFASRIPNFDSDTHYDFFKRML